MKKALFMVFALLISANFVMAQDDQLPVFGLWGLHNVFEMDKYFNFNQSASGARSMGMGGVYYAYNNKAYSSFLNPAGMSFVEKSQLSLDLFASLDKHEGAPIMVFTPGFYDPAGGFAAYSNVTDIDAKHNKFDQAGAVAPFYKFNREWWVGGGFRTALDLHSEFDMPSYYDDQQTSFTEHRGIDALNFALATNLIPQLGIGVNSNIFIRGYEQNYWQPINYIGEFGDTLTIVNHERDKSTFTGINFDFGAIYDFGILKLGAVLSSGYTLTQKTIFRNAYINAYGEDQGTIDRLTMKTKFPWTYGGGVAFEPMPDFSMGLDVTIKPYSKVRIDVDPQQNVYADTNGYDPEWEDLTQFRLGAEYIYDAGFAKIPIRAGLQNIPAVSKSGNIFEHLDTTSLGNQIIVPDSISKGDQFNTYLFAFGTGIQFEKIWFDAAYQFGSSSSDQTMSINGFLAEYNWDRSVKYKYSRFFFSVGMMF